MTSYLNELQLQAVGDRVNTLLSETQGPRVVETVFNTTKVYQFVAPFRENYYQDDLEKLVLLLTERGVTRLIGVSWPIGEQDKMDFRDLPCTLENIYEIEKWIFHSSGVITEPAGSFMLYTDTDYVAAICWNEADIVKVWGRTVSELFEDFGRYVESYRDDPRGYEALHSFDAACRAASGLPPRVA